MRRNLLSRVLAVAGFALVAGCLSPTLPLPPPEQPDTIRPSETVAGAWEVTGTCSPGARVIVLDERTGLGAVFEDRASAGRYFVELEASPCDVGSVSQELPDTEGSEPSAPTRFTFQATKGGTADDPTACR